jgi:hypothetical protein
MYFYVHACVKFLHQPESNAQHQAQCFGVQASSNLRQCSELLDGEEKADNQMRATYGDRWVRPLSNVLTSALRETIGRYQANLATAGESDARILSKLQANRSRLESLSAEGARSLVPTLQQPMIVPGVTSNVAVNCSSHLVE